MGDPTCFAFESTEQPIAGSRIAEYDTGVSLVAIGLGASEHEPLRGLRVTTDFEGICYTIGRFGFPTVLVQQGGYLSDLLTDNLAAVLSGIRG